MRSLIFPLVLLPLMAVAQPPPGYYDPTYQLSGEALRQALHEIINGHTVIPNDQLWDAFAITDAKPSGDVWDIYSDVPDGNPPYTFEFGQDQCGSYNSEGDCFNREHSFPQSWFGGSGAMDTDLFHLYPTDGWVNQQRGNLPYGTVGNVNWTSQNGSKRGDCSWPGCSGTVFEPINEYKGDLARSYFYMLTRYLPNLPAWDTPMLQGDNFTAWAASLILAWHVADPVSEKEIDRNNAIFELQGNRNPFIDQPQWAHYIWGPTASVSDVTVADANLWYSDGMIYMVTNGITLHELSIHDGTGRSISTYDLHISDRAITLELPRGIYFARLQTASGSVVMRFVR